MSRRAYRARGLPVRKKLPYQHSARKRSLAIRDIIICGAGHSGRSAARCRRPPTTRGAIAPRSPLPSRTTSDRNFQMILWLYRKNRRQKRSYNAAGYKPRVLRMTTLTICWWGTALSSDMSIGSDIKEGSAPTIDTSSPAFNLTSLSAVDGRWQSRSTRY